MADRAEIKASIASILANIRSMDQQTGRIDTPQRTLALIAMLARTVEELAEVVFAGGVVLGTTGNLEEPAVESLIQDRMDTARAGGFDSGNAKRSSE